MNYKKTVIIAILMGLIFIYGIVAGRYNVFPVDHLSDLANLVEDIQADEPYGDITIYETSLQRILVKSIKIEEDHSDDLFIRGGAIASIDNYLYLSSNRNDILKERLILFDVDNYQRIDTDGLRVPMNVEALMDSPTMDIAGFPFDRFRINGIYAENAGENTHRLFVSHNLYHPDERCISYSISRTTVEINQGSLQQQGVWDTILTAEPCLYPEEDKEGYEPYSGQMSGGPMVEYDDDHLLVSVGSFHRDGIKFESLTMDNSSTFGKILLLNKQTGNYSIYARGTRNALGLTIDSNGNIWATDNGPQGGDELNLVKEGNNFGWPEVSYGIDYNNMPWPKANQQGRHNQYDLPVFAWIPSIAPSSIIEITGRDRFKLWDGDLLIGTLRDQRLHRIRIEDKDRVTYNESIRIRNRIRDLTLLNDGKIALITDEGLLNIIDDGGTRYEDIETVEESRINELERFEKLRGGFKNSGMEAQKATAQSIFMQKCSDCHNLNGPNHIGPHLGGIFERNIGSLDDFNYSSALTNKNKQWNQKLMKSFLLNPNEEFKNTSMQEVSLTESEADSIIQFLME